MAKVVFISTPAELASIDAGHGQTIPTLWQVLQLIQNKCWLNIELKGANTLQPLLTLLQRAEIELGFDLQTLLSHLLIIRCLTP
ncbi:hypothetical protein [Alishewanella longhuensis]